MPSPRGPSASQESYPPGRRALRCATWTSAALSTEAWPARSPRRCGPRSSRSTSGSSAPDYDDVELLGKLVTREPSWHPAGLALHMANGAAFGAGYSLARPFIPGPPAAAGVLAAMVENFASWPLTAVVDRHHPAKGDLEPLSGNRRAHSPRPPGATSSSAWCWASWSAASTPRTSSSRRPRCRSRRTDTATSSTRPRPRASPKARPRTRTENLFITSEVLCQLS